jgi:poly-beta-1,6-N-acetyl-D-glucosamine synthase
VSIAPRIFAASAAIGGWVLVGYPAALAALPPRRWQRGDDAPTVAIVVPAFREREALRAKLAAMADLEYPRDRLQVVVAVDEDEELARIARATLPEATVLFSPTREGKAAAMTRALAHVDADVVVLTDANNVLAPASVRAAVRHFADPAIWAVAGRRGEAGSAYDRYEDRIRRLESRSGSVAAMSGEFVAVRRERLPGWPADVVNDDFWLLCHLVRNGGRVVYEPAAASTESALPADAEMRRRSRMGAGRVMAVSELRDLPPDFRWRVASHKFGRLVLPFTMVAAMLSSLAAARRPAYAAMAAAQLAVYALGGLAVAGRVPPGPGGKLARAAAQLLVGNAAVAIGVIRGLRRRQSVRWEPVS